MSEAARIVDVPASTFRMWARGRVALPQEGAQPRGAPIITSIKVSPRAKLRSIPFVGLTEAMVLAAIRKSGVPMQRIRPALEELQRGLGIQYALASKRLYSDGAELLFDYSESHPDSQVARATRQLVVVRNNQCVFSNLIDEYLQRFEYARDGYVKLIRVPGYEQAEIIVDPYRSSGAPIFARGGCRVKDVLNRYWAGETVQELTVEFGVPAAHVEDVIRVASPRAASALSRPQPRIVPGAQTATRGRLGFGNDGRTLWDTSGPGRCRYGVA